jgi:transcriptional regulator with XRE-family HTH domain
MDVFSKGEITSMNVFPAGNLGSAIKAIRKSFGMTQVEFAERLRTKQGVLTYWEAGKKRPGAEKILEIASITTDAELKAQLLDASGLTDLVTKPAEQTPGGYPKLSIRLLRDAAAAGTPRMIDESEVEQVIEVPKRLLPGESGGEIVAITVKGNSMEPMLLTGSIVFIDLSQRDPKRLVNAMVAARVDGGITIKFLRKMGKQYILIPFHVSPRYEVMPLSGVDGDAIVGRVLGWFSEPPTK